jgi:hypothetical protein
VKKFQKIQLGAFPLEEVPSMAFFAFSDDFPYVKFGLVQCRNWSTVQEYLGESTKKNY